MYTAKKIKGFTIVELLLVLALTSLTVSFSYAALNYVHKLFVGYNHQNNFINNYTRIKSAIDYACLKCDRIVEIEENRFVFYEESSKTQLILNDNSVVFKKGSQCDSLLIEAKQILKQYETMQNNQWQNKLLRHLSFNYEYKKQTFNFCLNKKLDAAIKLQLERTN